ncbi:MAG TPA: NAD(P)-dependent oxidoreductase [Verrucomicrobiae bacterium]|nr:NAD(P)-dependent oxidoreductase [Verrucomicrobiae bacterium]
MTYKTIAFYGAGMLGSGFVKSLRRQGYDVRVWNRTFEKAKALESVGALAFEDAALAARGADIVHICVRDGAAVDRVLASALPGIVKSAPIVDHTTVDVASVVPRAQRLRDAGYGFLHAPVFMGPPQAENAQGIMLASGPQQLFDAVRDHLATMTGKVKYLGERADLAAVYKLMGNAMILAVIGGLSDVLTIARAQGLTPVEAYELFSFYSIEGQITGRGKRMAEGDYSPLWTLDMAEKDARLMQAAAQGVPLPVIDAVDAAMRERIAQQLGDRDLGALSAH